MDTWRKSPTAIKFAFTRKVWYNSIMAKTNTTANTATVQETKRQKFTRLGAVRVSKALKAIDIVSNLAGPGYEYTPADVEKIKTALQGQLDKTIAAFSKDKTAAAKSIFSL